MDMELIREWLITKGVNPQELDELKEPPTLEDIGNALMFTFQMTSARTIWSCHFSFK